MMFSMKSWETLLILFLCLIHNCNTMQFSKKAILSNYKYQVDKNYTLSEGPIYAKGWLKYTNYEKTETNKPSDFFKNTAFYEQMKSGLTLNLAKSDNVGYLNIPDEDNFFFILTENTLNVLSSRKNNLAKTIDILNIDEILNNTGNSDFEGGVTNHGDFSEGYCFNIRSHNSKKKSVTVWELCSDKHEHKIHWMNTLVKLVQKINKKSSDVIAEENNMKNVISNLKQGISNQTLYAIRKSKSVTWVPITSWSECTKSCGGGKSYLQRLCVLPSDSKEKCDGERIITKECNLKDCESIVPDDELIRLKKKNSTSKLPKGIKYLPISRRPVRYERCQIKEGDLALYLNEGSIKGAKIPVRVILNNKTLTAYSNDDYESIIVSHRLSTITGLRKFEKEKSNTCFEIEESNKKTVLCALVSASKSLTELAIEWQKDILDFVKNCANSYSKDLNFQDMNEMSVEKVQNTLDFYQEKEKDQMEKVILKTQQLALQAIEKELKVENLIEKEEDLKQKKLEEQANVELDKIKKQKDLINQALQEKKKQADLYSNKLMIKKKIKQISEGVKREVMKIREDLRARILSKQKDEKRKRELIQGKINTLKKDISKNLLKASKNGNSEECNPERPTPEILEYCRVNYEFDNNKMNDCVKNDNFCYMCCESEFGDLHLESRSNCYTKCDDFYIYKVKFQNTKNIKLNIDVTSFGVKTNEIVDSKIVNEMDDKSIFNRKKKSKNGNNESIKSKFLETRMITETKSQSNFENNLDMNKLIEEEKKKELLLDIKQDLNF